jgi:hypothetical protein
MMNIHPIYPQKSKALPWVRDRTYWLRLTLRWYCRGG